MASRDQGIKASRGCAPTPRPAARTSSSRHASPTPASCRLLLWRFERWQACFTRPFGPRDGAAAARILRAHASRDGPTLRRHPCRRSLQIGRPTGWVRRSRFRAGVSGPSMSKSATRTPVTSARGRDPARIEGSRARMPGSRVVHRARTGGGRMPPVVRDSGGPEGRLRQACHRPAFPNRAGRMPASDWRVWTTECEPQDAASARSPTMP